MEEWRCYYEDEKGMVLVTGEGWETPQEAAVVGRQILEDPDLHKLEDPDGYLVSAEEVNLEAPWMIESDAGEQIDPEELEV